MNVVFVVLGLFVVGFILFDAFTTLLATSIRPRNWVPTAVFYSVTWAGYRQICLRIRNERRREGWLAAYGPLSFVALLGMWTLGQIFGWSLVWWGLRSEFTTPVHSYGAALYYSGVVYFSIGFGDILSGGGVARLLTVIEAFGGLGTLGLVIGYLPSLNSAYQAREKQLLLLDDLTDGRVMPATLWRSYTIVPGDHTQIDAMFTEWAAWCAEIFETHSSFPMLVLFRSKHRGHSWVTALGVVTDTAISHLAMVPGSGRDPAMRLYRQSCRLVKALAERLDVEPMPFVPLETHWWARGYSERQITEPVIRDFEDSYQRLNELRAGFHPYMEAFIDELLAPRGFWGPTSADHLREGSFADGHRRPGRLRLAVHPHTHTSLIQEGS